MILNNGGASEDRSDWPPLFILPGLLCDGRMFASQIDAFNATVINNFYGAADTVSVMADYALDRMPDHCALLGHSMGARVALEVWRKAPHRVARLALSSTGVHPVRPGERDARMALLDLGERSGAEALVDAWLPPMLGDAAASDQGVYDMLRAMCVDAGVPVYARQVAALLVRPDAQAVLPTVACPTMILVGAEDRWSPVEQHQTIVDAVPRSRLRIVPQAGHMAPTEAPNTFNSYLREWLAWDGSSPAADNAGEDRP